MPKRIIDMDSVKEFIYGARTEGGFRRPAPPLPGMEKLGPLPGVPSVTPQVERVQDPTFRQIGLSVVGEPREAAPGESPRSYLESARRRRQYREEMDAMDAGKTVQAPAPTVDDIQARPRGQRIAEGIVNTVGATAAGAVSGVGTILSAGEAVAQKAGIPGADGLGRAARIVTSAAEPVAGSDASAMGDFVDNPRLLELPEYWAHLGAQGLGSMIPTMVGGVGLQGALGAARMTAGAKAALGAVGGGFIESLMEAGGNYREAKATGAPEEIAAQVAARTFALNIGTNIAFQKAGGFFDEGSKGLVRRFLQGMTMEAAQEATQTGIQNYAAQAFDPSRPITKGMATAALGGAIAGGGVGMALDLAGTPGTPGQPQSPKAAPPPLPPSSSGAAPVVDAGVTRGAARRNPLRSREIAAGERETAPVDYPDVAGMFAPVTAVSPKEAAPSNNAVLDKDPLRSREIAAGERETAPVDYPTLDAVVEKARQSDSPAVQAFAEQVAEQADGTIGEPFQRSPELAAFAATLDENERAAILPIVQEDQARRNRMVERRQVYEAAVARDEGRQGPHGKLAGLGLRTFPFVAGMPSGGMEGDHSLYTHPDIKPLLDLPDNAAWDDVKFAIAQDWGGKDRMSYLSPSDWGKIMDERGGAFTPSLRRTFALTIQGHGDYQQRRQLFFDHKLFEQAADAASQGDARAAKSILKRIQQAVNPEDKYDPTRIADRTIDEIASNLSKLVGAPIAEAAAEGTQQADGRVEPAGERGQDVQGQESNAAAPAAPVRSFTGNGLRVDIRQREDGRFGALIYDEETGESFHTPPPSGRMIGGETPVTVFGDLAAAEKWAQTQTGSEESVPRGTQEKEGAAEPATPASLSDGAESVKPTLLDPTTKQPQGQSRRSKQKKKSAQVREKGVADEGKGSPQKGAEEAAQSEGDRSGVVSGTPDAEPTSPAGVSRLSEKDVLAAVQAKLDKAADDARQRLKKKFAGQLFTGLDPEILGDLVVIGASHMARGAITAAKWTAKMVEEFGEGIRKHLPHLRPLSEEHFERLLEDARGAQKESDNGIDGSAATESETEGNAEQAAPPADSSEQAGDGEGDAPVTLVEGPAVQPGGRTRRRRQNLDLSRDYRITDADQLGQGGDVAKFRANIAAIKVIKAIEKEGRTTATPEEQAVLVRYVGWGALSQAAFEYQYDRGNTLRKLQEELSDLVSTEEYQQARRSTQNAHYTSADVVSGMWRAVERLGIRPESRVLEPSAGTGNFLGLQPEHMLGPRAAVEKDALTAKIATLLYPGSNVQHSGFESAALPGSFFDLAISNVPFGKIPVTDRAFRGDRAFLTERVHNYFFAKALDVVRPGGLVAFVTTHGTLDAADAARVRRYLADRAELVGAIRLPGGKKGAFAANAGTDVTTDIIFLRKLREGEPIPPAAWVESAPMEVDGPDGRTTINVNRYFHQHPEMMLGEMTAMGTRYREGMPQLEGEFTAEALATAVDRLPQGVISYEQTPQPGAAPIILSQQQAETIREGGYGVDERGGIVRREDGALAAVKMNAKQTEQAKRILGLRDAVREVFRTQEQERPDTEITAARDVLNARYDEYVAQHGTIHATKLLNNDPEFPVLLGLESFDKSTKTAKKTAIFSRRTIAGYQPPSAAKTPAEALAISLAETGRVDVPRMQALLSGMEEAELVEALEGRVFREPGGQLVEAEEYLSGNVREKLKEAEAAAKLDGQYAKNVLALKAVQPADIPASQIAYNIGASWIPAEVVTEWIQFELGAKGVRATYTPALAKWQVSVEDGALNSAANIQKGVVKKSGEVAFRLTKLIELALDLRTPKVMVGDDDGPKIVDQEATDLAIDRLKALRKSFQEFMLAGERRSSQLARIFNDTHNNWVERKWDGSHLTFPGMNTMVLRGGALEPHQSAVIWRTIKEGVSLFAHEVGAGKTYELIAAGMRMKQMGLARKPIYVLPKASFAQFEAAARTLYPSAKILVADIQKGSREKTVAQVASGEYDLVLMTKETFYKIPVSPEYESRIINAELEDLRAALRDAEGASDTATIGGRRRGREKKSPTVKAIERAIETSEARLKELAEGAKDNAVYFEHLGVDHLFVDESHAFKNLQYTTTMDRVAGMGNPNGSKRAFDMKMKTGYILDKYGRRGVTFATGTPVSNAFVELYSLMRFLIPGRLEDLGISKFDAWARVFTTPDQRAEPDPTDPAKFRAVTVLNFNNVPELIRLYRSFADVKTAADLQLPRPPLENGKPTIIKVPQSPELQELLMELSLRMEDVRGKRRTPEEQAEDNALLVTFHGRQGALDMRLLKPDLPDNPNSKVNRVVDEVYKRWDRDRDVVLVDSAGEAVPGRGTAQAIFLDMSIPAATAPVVEEPEDGQTAATEESPRDARFDSVYDDIKAKLVRRGVPASEIAFIHDAKNAAQREDLFDRVNGGQVRIILGGTERLGTGVNIQRRLRAMHHVDAPWRPSDLTQRNGRGLRQGNLNDMVEAVYYVTEKSYDARLWDMIENKAAMVELAMRGDNRVRQLEDTSSIEITAADAKALAQGDPRIGQKMQLENRVRTLTNIKRAVADQKRGAETNLRLQRESRDYAQAQVAARAADVAAREKWMKDNGVEDPSLGNALFDGKKAISAEDFLARLFAAAPGAEVAQYAGQAITTKGEVAEVAMGMGLDTQKVQVRSFRISGAEGSLRIDSKPLQVGQRLKNLWSTPITESQAFADRVAAADAALSSAAATIPEFDRAEELAKAQADLDVIEQDIRDNPPPKMDFDGVTFRFTESAKAISREKKALAAARSSAAKERRMARGMKAAAKPSESGRLSAEPLVAALDYMATRIRDIRAGFARPANRAERKEAAGDWSRWLRRIKPDSEAFMAYFVRPARETIALAGSGAGRNLAWLLQRTIDVGERMAGEWTYHVAQSGIAKLSREQRILLDGQLRGRDSGDESVRRVARQVRGSIETMLDTFAGFGLVVETQSGPVPIEEMADGYTPRVYRGAAQMRSGPVRRDILESLRQRGVPDAEAALDAFVEFFHEGAEPSAPLAQFGDVDSLKRWRTHARTAGTLMDHSVDLPFWDPDPARVLPHWMAEASAIFAKHAHFGEAWKDGVAREIRRVVDAGGDPQILREAVDRSLGILDRQATGNRAVNLAITAAMWKLGLAFIANATQSLNTLLATDATALWAGIRAARTAAGQGIAIRSGAVIDPVLAELKHDAGTMSSIQDRFLAVFSTVERFNRIVAANAGHEIADRLFAAAGRDAAAAERLREFGVDPQEALRRGRLSDAERLMVAKKVSDYTQFRSREIDMPGFAKTPVGRLLVQFKTFAYHQLRFMGRELIGEVQRGNYGRASRNFVLAAAAYPAAGIIVAMIRAGITGDDRLKKLEGFWDWWSEGLIRSGALGILMDVLRTTGGRQGAMGRTINALEFLGGPTIGLGADMMVLVGELQDEQRASKALLRFLRRHAPLGAVAVPIYERGWREK